MRLDTDDLGPALLFCPGERPERFAKAAAAADTAVLDLEDGVAADAKDRARAAVTSYVERSTGDSVAIRINHPSSERGRNDAAAVIAAGARLIILPKTEAGSEVDSIVALGPQPESLRIIVTVETARGVLALPDILARPAVAAVSWGPYDLAADMGARTARDASGRLLAPLAHARNQILLCAAAARTMALDTVTTELRDPAILQRDAEESAASGFQGKFAIHPSQIDVIRRSFCPAAEEIERCRRLIAAVPSYGAFLFDGEMIDEPMLRRARRTLAIAERAAAQRR